MSLVAIDQRSRAAKAVEVAILHVRLDDPLVLRQLHIAAPSRRALREQPGQSHEVVGGSEGEDSLNARRIARRIPTIDLSQLNASLMRWLMPKLGCRGNRWLTRTSAAPHPTKSKLHIDLYRTNHFMS